MSVCVKFLFVKILSVTQIKYYLFILYCLFSAQIYYFILFIKGNSFSHICT